MKTQIITIGNEILIGDIINTNASWLGEQLTLLGFTVSKMVTVGDSLSDILDVLNDAQSADFVVVTGGLGPTHDDVTKKAFQEFFKVGLTRNQEVFDFVQSFFVKRGIPFSPSNAMQADVLENAEVLFNKWGTAPGMWIDQKNTCWAILPGVPKEMKNIFTEQVRQRLQLKFPIPNVIKSAYLSVAGIGESTLADTRLKPIESLLSESTTLAYLPHHDGITLRITSTGTDENRVLEEIDAVKRKIIELASDVIYSDSRQTLGEVVGNLLLSKGWSIGLAESCTGGGVGFELTHTAGCSAYVKGGVIAYANEVKVNQLGVQQKTLDTFGAVSQQTALEMALGIRNVLKTDVGISITGIAGPGGGSEEKPVGLIWFGISTPNETFAFKVVLTKDRELNRKRAIMIVLDALRRSLLGIQSLPYDAQKIMA